MYEDTIFYLTKGMKHLKNEQYEKATSSYSLAEAYLPIIFNIKNISKLVSRNYTICRYISSDEFKITINKNEFSQKLIQATEYIIKLIKTQFNDVHKIKTIHSELQYYVSVVGEIERINENSAWGKIVKDIIS